jgi:leucyl aminopeptidase
MQTNKDFMLRVSQFSALHKSFKAELVVVALTAATSAKKSPSSSFDSSTLSKSSKHLLDEVLGSAWQRELITREFKAKGFNDTLVLRSQSNKIRYIMFVGSSKQSKDEQLSFGEYRSLGYSIGSQALGLKTESIAILSDHLHLTNSDATKNLLEGIHLASYKSPTFKKTTAKPFLIKTLQLQGIASVSTIKKAQAIAQAVAQARDWVNLPASHCTPSFFVREAKRIAKTPGLTIVVLDKAKLKRMKAGGILGVNAGSTEPPALVKISYKPTSSGKKTKKIALVGKGVMFDSGGYSLKPAAGMMTMKCDMAGAAAVLATMQAVATLKPKVEIHCYIPIVENMVNSEALRPGDIIHLLGGKSIEVLNTDAEGRLILADALTLAVKERPDAIIDLATLTGACVAALGSDYAGLFSNNDALSDGLLSAGQQTGENLWRLPLAKEYRKMLDSPVADMKNIGGSSGGAITAALFLKEFVADTPWAHLDIAGPAFLESASGISPRGGTGFGVATLIQFLCS